MYMLMIIVDIFGIVMHTSTCVNVCVLIGGEEPRLKPNLAIAESY